MIMRNSPPKYKLVEHGARTRLTVRVPDELYFKIALLADEQRISVNEYITQCLEKIVDHREGL